jgi:hypothetical protein
MYSGTSPFAFTPAARVRNPVLTRADVTDVEAVAVADPFMLRVEQRWYMFFEIYNRRTARGQIGLATSENGLQWTYQRVVLDEPFHLSYPYVFAWENDYFMLPECFETGSVRLYKAAPFPTHWTCVHTLLQGGEYVDPSIFQFDRKWWLFTSQGTAPLRAETLRLHYAETPFAPWVEHPQSPVIVQNARIARPAGRVVVLEDGLVRYSQDCQGTYGALVRAFAIDELTTKRYHEHEVAGTNPVLTGSGTGWNKSGMHHIDPYRLEAQRFLACADGWVMLEAPE